MTIFLPLDENAALPQSPSFLLEADRDVHLRKVVQAIMKAKRIVVICGAGISVQAGIPDFRSQDGLFKSIKRDNPREALTSGKDLFDASVFNTEQRTALFCQMMAQLADLSQNAEPTSFHNLLRALNDRGRLLRVYTQNIDALEQKCGLSFGVPEFEGKRWRGRPKGRSLKNGDPSSDMQTGDGQPPLEDTTAAPSTEIPRCIPLHGTLQMMHCHVCNHSFPLQDYIPSLNAGHPPSCPECINLQKTRAINGKRPRAIGKLRPSVVLYNEAHNNGEGVGDVVQKDLIGSKGKGKSGADLLLVVGTSLKVPGTKRMVREFAKAVKTRAGVTPTCTKEDPVASTSPASSSPAGSSRQSPSSDDEPPPAPMRAVYLNLDFPAPTREWEGVFDAWVQGDAQTFANMLRDEIAKEAKVKELALEKKRRREQEAAAAAEAALTLENEMMDVDVEVSPPQTTALPSPQTTPKRKGKAKARLEPEPTSVKRQKTTSSSHQDIRPGQMHSSYSHPPTTPPRHSTPSTTASGLPTPETTPRPRFSHPRAERPESFDDLQRAVSPVLSESVRNRLAEMWPPNNRVAASHSNPVVMSSIRSTLLDHEREFGLVAPPLVDLSYDGFRGHG